MKISVVPYEPAFEQPLLELERTSPQGKMIQLEMRRDRFDSRSVVFEDYRVFVAVNEKREVLGVSGIAIVPISVNGAVKKMGLGYDLKVAPAYRGLGISKMLGRHLVEEFLKPNEIDNYCVTLKDGNERVIHAVKFVDDIWYTYPFMYLTVPTWRRVLKFPAVSEGSKFGVTLFADPARLPGYLKKISGGLGLWNTHLCYTIGLRKIHPLMKVGVAAANFLLPRHRQLPDEGVELKFASLFDFTSENFHQVNKALTYLQAQGIQYLSVCCTKDDFMYRLLKPLSINAYDYLLLTNFETKPGDRVSIDVRCL